MRRGKVFFNTISILILFGCSDREGNREGSLVQTMEVSISILEAYHSLDNNIAKETESIRKRGDIALEEMEHMNSDQFKSFSFNSSVEVPVFSESIEALKTYLEEHSYQWVYFDKLVGKFPYLNDFQSLVYDSYTIKKDGKTLLILWHLNGFENIRQVNEFNAAIFSLKETEKFDQHYKRFKYWGYLYPKDVVLIQAGEKLKETEPDLFGILYHQFTVRKYSIRE